MKPESESGTKSQPHTNGSSRIPHRQFSFLSLIIGLATLAGVLYVGMHIGISLSVPSQDSASTLLTSPATPVSKKIVPSETQLSSACPQSGWIDCTTKQLAQSNICTPEYLAYLQGICPQVKGAQY